MSYLSPKPKSDLAQLSLHKIRQTYYYVFQWQSPTTTVALSDKSSSFGFWHESPLGDLEQTLPPATRSAQLASRLLLQLPVKL